jgi:hypothetical protein
MIAKVRRLAASDFRASLIAAGVSRVAFREQVSGESSPKSLRRASRMIH